MLNLIVKDILIQKKQVLIAIIYIPFFIFIFQNIGSAMFATGVFAFVYILMSSACALEDKNNTDIMLNSLPVKRTRIIAAKYLSVFVYFLAGTVIYLITADIIKIMGIPLYTQPFTLDAIVAGVVIMIIMTGIYLPVFFKFGYAKSKVLIFLLFFVFFFGISSLTELMQKVDTPVWAAGLMDIFKSGNNAVTGLITLAFMLLVYMASYGLSVFFYNKKEF